MVEIVFFTNFWISNTAYYFLVSLSLLQLAYTTLTFDPKFRHLTWFRWLICIIIIFLFSKNHLSNEFATPPPKPRSNTMPAQDLSRISKIFTSDSDYEVMSPSKSASAEKPKKSLVENFYMPMLPLKYLKLKTETSVTVDIKKTWIFMTIYTFLQSN